MDDLCSSLYFIGGAPLAGFFSTQSSSSNSFRSLTCKEDFALHHSIHRTSHCLLRSLISWHYPPESKHVIDVIVHPDDLTLSLWSGRIRFPYGLRLNADAINEELAKSAPSASGDSSGGVGDRIRRRGRGNSSVAEGSPSAPNFSRHATSSVAAGYGSAAAPDGTTPKASSGGGGGGIWSPFLGWSRSSEVPDQQSTTLPSSLRVPQRLLESQEAGTRREQHRGGQAF